MPVISNEAREYMRELGKIGGSRSSVKKRAAAVKNARLGGLAKARKARELVQTTNVGTENKSN